jgi:branched-chain amino acid transport system substrate-binding protein
MVPHDIPRIKTPSIGRVPGSAGFAAHDQTRYGPIANYAVNAYDSARLLLITIETAAKSKGTIPARDEVITALRGSEFQGPPVPGRSRGTRRATTRRR